MTCPAGFTFDFTPRNSKNLLMDAEIPTDHLNYLDRKIVWTENHIPYSRLESMRHVGDEIADAALDVLRVKPGDDAFQMLVDYTSQPESQQQSPAPQLLMDQLMAVPDWVDWDQIKRGQDVVWRNFFYVGHILVHFSLVYGFTAPKISKVLTSTNYLSGAKTQTRVFETALFVLDTIGAPGNLKPGTGVAWKSIIQVRFLHSAVRTRLVRMSRAHSKVYSVEEHGLPINQEDYMATLLSLSGAVWQVMESRMNLPFTEQEKADFLHLWRYIGFLMGVDDTLGVTETPTKVDACSESLAIHMLRPDFESGRAMSTMFMNLSSKFRTQSSQSSKLTRIPRPYLYMIHMALSEQLMGPRVWGLCGLPKIPPLYRVIRFALLTFLRMDRWLIYKLPWLLRARTKILHKLLVTGIHMKIGDSKHKFGLKELPKENKDEIFTPARKESSGRSSVFKIKHGSQMWSMFLTSAASAAVCVGIAMAKRH